MKKSVKDLNDRDLKGKRVFVRVDFNTPLNDGVVSDDTKIREVLPTINYLSAKGAKVILASHLGRPKGEVKSEYSLTPVQKRLSELIGHEVIKTSDCIGAEVESEITKLKDGDILLLENLRFHKEETENDPDFAKKLANLADIFVSDAFGTAHRGHASQYGIGQYIPGYAGLLMEKELQFLGDAVLKPKRPFIAIIGGSKVSTKITVLGKLLELVDVLVIGGAMVFTFLLAQGYETGKSLVETDKLDVAKDFLKKAENSKTKVVFPIDQVVVHELGSNAPSEIVDIKEIPEDMMGVDIGPKSIEVICQELENAQTVLWNGPLGIFEVANFAKGTFAVAKALANSDAISIIGGGDSSAAIVKAGLKDKVSHVSTGGGASLEFLEGKELPGVSILQDKE